eukprot:GHVO01057809.1.p1 GENE.GHVO01057809.1~~GHVO01057809.1.p1  ORF type:complete len:124 (+),score=11.00 GHVO01057809.1:42-413(+)
MIDKCHITMPTQSHPTEISAIPLGIPPHVHSLIRQYYYTSYSHHYTSSYSSPSFSSASSWICKGAITNCRKTFSPESVLIHMRALMFMCIDTLPPPHRLPHFMIMITTSRPSSLTETQPLGQI